ncbi:hypothetical protein HPB49_003190 [Dermacentor silvarum]|uniref:Uncharacterized protein n=1 Tax=Dermacentor silvarum TaxID=543639 RepID=A0ACB8DTF4_DERSI|nr:hypothetical protein HPB49_003190 [Dermacentor silvarum]
MIPYALNGPFPEGEFLLQQDLSPVHTAKVVEEVLNMRGAAVRCADLERVLSVLALLLLWLRPALQSPSPYSEENQLCGLVFCGRGVRDARGCCGCFKRLVQLLSPVSKMEPQSGRLRESAAYMVGSYPSECLAVHQLYSNLRCLRRIMGHRRLDLYKSCTASAADGCFHLAQLSLWNNFLWVINIELRQGRLALACLRGRGVTYSFLQLMGCCCIECVELCKSRSSQEEFLLRDVLSVYRNLRHARLCYQLLDYPTRDLMDALRSTVTTLDTLEIVSVRFSSVGVSMLSELLDRFDAMGTLVFLDNWIDVPEAEALLRLCAAHRCSARSTSTSSSRRLIPAACWPTWCPPA